MRYVSDKALLPGKQGFVLENILGVFFNGCFSLPPVKIREGSFLALHHENHKFPGGQMPERVPLSPQTSLQLFLTLTLVHLASSNLSKLPLKCPYQFTTSVAFVLGKQISAVSLDVPILPDYRVAYCPENLALLDSRIVFSFFTFLLIEGMN